MQLNATTKCDCNNQQATMNQTEPTFGGRLGAGRGDRVGRAAVSAGQRAERPLPNAERVTHVLAQVFHHGIDRLLDAGVDAIG